MNRDHLEEVFADPFDKSRFLQPTSHFLRSIERIFRQQCENDKKAAKVTFVEEWEKSCRDNFERCQQELRQSMSACVGQLITCKVAELQPDAKYRLCYEAVTLMRKREIFEKVENSRREI